MLLATALLIAWLTVKLRKSDSDLQLLVQANANARIAEADAGRARKQAEVANLRAANLEHEAAQARLELARIDPINIPITSIRAELFVEVSGVSAATNKTFPKIGAMDLTPFNLIDGKDSSFLSLECVRNEANLVLHDGESEPSGRMFSFSFQWPSSNLIEGAAETHPGARSWIEREKVSSAVLDRVMFGAGSRLPGVPEGIEIVSGSYTIVINGSILRRLTLRKTTRAAGYLFLVPEKSKTRVRAKETTMKIARVSVPIKKSKTENNQSADRTLGAAPRS